MCLELALKLLMTLGLLHHINSTTSSLPVVIITGKPSEKSESFHLEKEQSASSVNRLTARLWWTFYRDFVKDEPRDLSASPSRSFVDLTKFRPAL